MVIVKTIPMDADVVIDPADQAKVDAVKAAFDKEIGALRPDFAKDKNITAFVLSEIRGYSDIDTKDVTVALKTTGRHDIHQRRRHYLLCERSSEPVGQQLEEHQLYLYIQMQRS